MNKTPAVMAGALVQLGGEPDPLNKSRTTLKASPAARMRLEALLFGWREVRHG